MVLLGLLLVVDAVGAARLSRPGAVHDPVAALPTVLPGYRVATGTGPVTPANIDAITSASGLPTALYLGQMTGSTRVWVSRAGSGGRPVALRATVVSTSDAVLTARVVRGAIGVLGGRGQPLLVHLPFTAVAAGGRSSAGELGDVIAARRGRAAVIVAAVGVAPPLADVVAVVRLAWSRLPAAGGSSLYPGGGRDAVHDIGEGMVILAVPVTVTAFVLSRRRARAPGRRGSAGPASPD